MSESEEIGAAYRKVIETLERKIARLENELENTAGEIQKALETCVESMNRENNDRNG